MDRSAHTLAALFAQLGMDNRQSAISQFIQSHRGLAAEIPLAQADFWNSAQSDFLYEAVQQDSDWSEVVDSFDALLR